MSISNPIQVIKNRKILENRLKSEPDLTYRDFPIDRIMIHENKPIDDYIAYNTINLNQNIELFNNILKNQPLFGRERCVYFHIFYKLEYIHTIRTTSWPFGHTF